MMVDSRGILGPHRDDLKQLRYEYPEKWDLCARTNHAGRQGGIAEALRGADVVISLAQPGPNTILPEWIRSMAADPIVFACANPVPEIWPWEALAAGAAVVATGRSDFPNQVNNSMVFPGLFRGTLDVRATTITDEMCFACADALVARVADTRSAQNILPTMEDRAVFPEIAVAVGLSAIAQGLAQRIVDEDTLRQEATAIIERSHQMVREHMHSGLIADPPEDLDA